MIFRRIYFSMRVFGSLPIARRKPVGRYQEIGELAEAERRVDHEHVLALVEAVHGAHVDAVHDFAANTALVDDEGQLSVLSADRSGNLIHGVGPSSRCLFIGSKWTHRRPTSSG